MWLGGIDGIIAMVASTLSLQALSLRRRKSNRVLAGVAGGIADTLGIRDGYVRAAFLTLLTVWGLGGLLYMLAWLATFDRVEDADVEIVEPRRAAGLGLAFSGMLLMMGAIGMWPNPVLVLTTAALSFGIAAITDPSSPGPLAALMSPGVETVSKWRLIIGGMLLIGGIAMFSVSLGQVFDGGIVFLAMFLTGLGILVAFGPWVRRLLTDLGNERSERIRQEERAEMAAHLHDSVLQTLALIQRSDDPQRMAILARHQESELRDWLFGTAPLDGIDRVSSAMKQAAERIEEDFGVPIDVVTVGDCPVDERTRALVAAASEAMVNAAKHSGADRVSLFLEVEDHSVVVFVTDQGKGFDTDSIPRHRKGIVESILTRMEKAGGRAAVESVLEEGTEVMLGLDL